MDRRSAGTTIVDEAEGTKGVQSDGKEETQELQEPQDESGILPVDLFGLTGVSPLGNGYTRFKAKDWTGAEAEFVVPDGVMSQRMERKEGADLAVAFQLWVKAWK